MKLTKFYRSINEFQGIHQRLKQTSCPHCKTTGYLILHGYLFGYDLNSNNRRIMRGHRVFCSNRNRKDGCGKTFSILKADILKRFIIQTSHLWIFLINIVKGMTTFEAFRSVDIPLSQTSIYRLYKRIYLNQHKIRTLLLRDHAAPKDVKYTNPLIKTILHIKSAFQNNQNPLATFQLTFQVSFL